MLWPKPLECCDTIRMVAPAGKLDCERMQLAKRRLEARGYQVQMPDEVFAEHGFLAGTDERRAKELMAAFTDPEVDAVFPGTGGYGTMRILEMLDYDAIRQNPKMLIGFSDITALHAAINQNAGLVTYHSPLPMYGLGSEDNLSPFSAKYFFQAIEKDKNPQAGYVIEPPADGPEPFALGTGKAQGRLVGGNLSLIAALVGTPYEIDTDGAILLLEDTREAPYRVDRMLRQMQLAGNLANLSGVLVGQFTENYDREKDQLTDDKRFTVTGVLEQYLKPLGIPVLMNFPVGHFPKNATLPLGGQVEIDADAVELRILPHE